MGHGSVSCHPFFLMLVIFIIPFFMKLYAFLILNLTISSVYFSLSAPNHFLNLTFGSEKNPGPQKRIHRSEKSAPGLKQNPWTLDWCPEPRRYWGGHPQGRGRYWGGHPQGTGRSWAEQGPGPRAPLLVGPLGPGPGLWNL